MKRLMVVAVIAAIAAPTWLAALTKSYDVVPYRNCIAQTDSVAPNNKVSQYLRNTLDDITRVSVWVGDASDPALFSVQVKDTLTDSVVAEKLDVPAQGSWSWLHFDFDTNFVKPIRGRDYAVIVTRQGGAPISFAYCDTNAYKYGHISVPGANPPIDTVDSDLALRIYGYHSQIDASAFGTNFHQFYQETYQARNALGKGKQADLHWMRDDLGGWKTFWRPGDTTTLPEEPVGVDQVREKVEMYTDSGFQVLGVLCYGLDSFSTKPGTPGTLPEDAPNPIAV